MADLREEKNRGGASLRRDFKRRAERLDAREDMDGGVVEEEVSSAAVDGEIDEMSSFDDNTDGIVERPT